MRSMRGLIPFNSKHFLYIFMLCFILFSIYVHISAYKNPYIGIVITENDRSQWVVNEVISAGKGNYWNIIPGDIILSLGSERQPELLSHGDLYLIQNASDLLVLKQNGQQQHYQVVSETRDIYTILLSGVLELLLLGIGWFAIRSRPTSKVMRLFCILNLLMACCILSTYSPLVMPAYFVLLFCGAWLPYLLLSFYLSFMFSNMQKRFEKLLLSYQVYSVLCSIFYLILVYYNVYMLNNTYEYKGAAVSSTGNISAALLYVSIIATLVLLVWLTYHYRKWFNRVEKNQQFVLCVGIVLCLLPFILLYALPALVIGRYIMPIEYTLIGFIPLSCLITYVLVQRNMLDIRLYIPRILIHGVYVLIAFILFAAAVKLDTSLSLIVLFTGFLLLTYIYQRSLILFRRKAERRKDWLGQQQLRLSIEMAEQKNTREMLRLFADMLHSMVETEGMCLIWNDGQHFFFHGTGKYKALEKEKLVHLDSSGLLQSFDFAQVIELSQIQDQDQDKSQSQSQEISGYLCVGPKENGTLFSAEEQAIIDKGRIEAIQILINVKLLSRLQREYDRNKDQAVLYERQVSDIRQFNQLLLESQEAERIRTSYFLHDHLLQNLIFLTRDLEELHDTGEGARENVAAWLQCLYDSQHDIRKMCDDLYPHIIDRGDLKDALDWLLRTLKEKSRTRMELIYQLPDGEPRQELIKNHIFRTIRELLHNVLKHAGATKVQVHLWSEPDRLYCQVTDDGQGFQVNEVFSQSSGQKRFGLISVRNSIRHLGGETSIDSAPGQGTSVMIRLPLIKEESQVERE
ncbi:sensor histidine kinase [Paenibacillus eucommiae]|uniref:Two-component system sensor histidine kinase ComP n=1 Tax=Paenibacillus eucommiae TaxID=1355755 RepID=A0ABS4J8F1_9BACL|nr:ATP-binding protein [Paenibacillus eucommiae]MBP1996128.1 two-component system sensor histidine kinase ComP [Paenibacillus eucommiae]